MWKSFNKVDLVNLKDYCFDELYEECKLLPFSGKLSMNLRSRLEKFSVTDRRDIVNRRRGGCAPLFIACKRGLLETVEYLINHCKADIEQKGVYEVPEDRSTHSVTPLWCAAVSGRLAILKFLISNGANVNAVSDTGSTPVRSACYMTHLEIVWYLVENGADINRPNFNGGTCLINSVQSIELCKFLISHGADVNAQDIQNKTALHYAIQERRLQTTKLLLSKGADHTAISKYGDDALQTACLKGAINVFDELIKTINYSKEQLANAHELLGTTYVDELANPSKGIEHWRIAQKIRDTEGIPKKEMEPLQAYRYQKEFASCAELDNLLGDTDLLRTNCLLILERILTPYHKDTIFRLMFRGATYADLMRYQKCIDLWLRALEIRVAKDSILYSDTCFTAQALIRFMIDYNVTYAPNVDDYEFCEKQSFEDTVKAFNLLTSNITEAKKLLSIKPHHKRQVENFDKMLRCITHLIYLMIEYAKTAEQYQVVKKVVSRVLKQNVRSFSTEDTLLHMCVSKLNTIRSGYFNDDDPIGIFPKRHILEFMIICGADVNARNNKKSTPLHIATAPYNNNDWLVQLLLDNGGHIDQPNSSGERPVDKINLPPFNLQIPITNYITLKCLSATVIGKFKIPFKGIIPTTLENYIEMHEA